VTFPFVVFDASNPDDLSMGACAGSTRNGKFCSGINCQTVAHMKKKLVFEVAPADVSASDSYYVIETGTYRFHSAFCVPVERLDYETRMSWEDLRQSFTA